MCAIVDVYRNIFLNLIAHHGKTLAHLNLTTLGLLSSTVDGIKNESVSHAHSTTSAHSGNATRRLSTTSATFGDTDAGDNYEMPQIPAYIRTTSMFFCLTIMVLGVIGNVMVRVVVAFFYLS